MRAAVRSRVELAVTATLARLEPGGGGSAFAVLTTRDVEDGSSHGSPCHAVRRADDPPAMRGDPVHGRAVDDARGGALVDPEVVPVDQQDEVGKAQSECRVEHLVRGARGQAALALDREDLDFLSTGHLERQGLSRRERHAMAGRPGVRLEEQRLAGHLGMSGQAAAMPECPQVLPGQRPATIVGKGEAGFGVDIMPRSETLVEDGQRGVDQRHGVPRGQDESVGEAEPWAPDVPAHRPGQERGQQQVALRPRTARVSGLAVVEGQVDAFVDDVEEDLVALEVGLGGRVELADWIEGCGHRGPDTSPPSSRPRRARALRASSRWRD